MMRTAMALDLRAIERQHLILLALFANTAISLCPRALRVLGLPSVVDKAVIRVTSVVEL
jgi:hypothetical protein